MDILVGVVLLFVIPIAAYIILGVLGLPVSGRKGMSTEEKFAQNESQAIKRSYSAPLGSSEFEKRLERVQFIVDQRVPYYIGRARQEDTDKPMRIGPWATVARAANDEAKREVETLLKDLDGNDAFGSSHRGRLTTYRNRISGLTTQINDVDPFSRID